MPPSTSTRVSITVLRRENEAKIFKFLRGRIGPPPTASLCPKHLLKVKKLCTSQTDPHLTHAGQWFSFCKPCNRIYFSDRAIDIQDLIINDGEFRALIQTRRSLHPKPRPGPRPRGSTTPTPMGNGMAAKAFILWTESKKLPTLVSFICDRKKPIRLVDYRKTLEDNGVAYGRAVEVFDASKNTWLYLEWSAEYSFSGHNVLLKYSGLDNVANFGMFFP